MKITKCDRCGKVFSPFEEAKNYDLYEEYWRYNISFDAHPYPEDSYDLCSECKKSLYKWIKGGE